MDKTGRLAALLPDEGDAALVLTPHNRRYLTGFPSSAGWLVVSRKGAWFFTDFRYIEAAKMRVNGAECRMITRVPNPSRPCLPRPGSGASLWKAP